MGDCSLTMIYRGETMDSDSSAKVRETLEPSVVNIVATADLKQRVDLHSVAELEYVIYDSEIYGGRVAYLKTPDMEGKVSIFNSGKLISVGTRTKGQAQKELQRTADILSKYGLIRSLQVTTITRNIVATLNHHRPIDLEMLAIEKFPVIYEPDQFPGAIMKLTEQKATALIFASGKMIITGISSYRQLKRALEEIDKLVI